MAAILLARDSANRLFSVIMGVISGQVARAQDRESGRGVVPEQGYIEALFAVVRGHGLDPEDLVAHAGRQGRAPDFLRLCASALELTGDPALGVRFGARLDLTSHGILGYALMSSRTLDEVLQRLMRYIGLSAPEIRFERVLQGERCLVVCRLDAGATPAHFLVDAALVAVVVSAQRLIGAHVLAEAELWFQGPPPGYAAQYSEVTGVPTLFGRPFDAVSIPRRFLEAPVLSADPAMAELCGRQCEKLLANMRDRPGLAGRIREQLLRAPGSFPDIRAIAARFGMSERTLRRHLDAEGTAYRTLIDEVRLELARSYLASTQLPVTEIAALLGYEDPANFRRAFRRLQGCSPADYRAASPHDSDRSTL
jgi:AraC-like DNA-binding protein